MKFCRVLTFPHDQNREAVRPPSGAFLQATADCDWVQGVGLGLVEDEPGLTISVVPGKIDTARSLLKTLALDVPIELRELGEISARHTATGYDIDDPNALQALRDLAAKRLDDLNNERE